MRWLAPRGRRWRVALRTAVVLAILLLALLIRLRAAALLPTDFDEDDYLRAGQLYAQHLAAGDLRGIIDERENYEHPPMTKLAFGAILWQTAPASAYSKPVVALVGNKNGPAGIAKQVRALQVFNAVVGAATAGVVAIVNPLAGLLIAVNSWHAKYTSQAMLEALPCLFATLALLGLRRSRHTPGRGAAFWAAAVALGLAAAGKYLYGVAGFAALIWLLQDWRQWRRALAWGGLAVLAFYLADPALWLDPVGRLSQSLLFSTGYATGKQVQQTGFGWAQPLVWLLTQRPGIPAFFRCCLMGCLGWSGCLGCGGCGSASGWSCCGSPSTSSFCCSGRRSGRSMCWR